MRRLILTFSILLLLTGLQLMYAQQQNVRQLKSEAVKQMQIGRYGEAIELLHRYVAAFPHEAEGFNLRGLCFEKRGQYELGVYDFRLARSLEPNNAEIQKNLDRLIKIWYAELNKKIDGHRREIAINPNVAVNYLEIGKCYKHMGEWIKAEEWYDQYYARDKNASADEIIRYTEIMARNGNIAKGEPILKLYVERYPTDHRLWSRYGYFTLWLGKIKIAIEAFETALRLRPFFKEAQDGLDQAKGKGYIFTYYDTTSRKGPPAPPEYAIDKYYRSLRNNPDDDETRFLLVDELWRANRMEEAFQQLEILSQSHSETPRFEQKWDAIIAYRDSFYNANTEKYQQRLTANPSDREAVLKIGEFYAYQQLFDEAIDVYEEYMDLVPSAVNDDELMFRYAQLTAWNRQFFKAMDPLDNLLVKNPNNLEYQLFRAQLAVWTGQDLDIAETYLDNVLRSEPDKIEAIIAMGSLHLLKFDLYNAREYLERARVVDPENDAVLQFETSLTFLEMRLEEQRIYSIVEEGRQLFWMNDCYGALYKYDEFMALVEPSPSVMKEYADVNACAGNHETALSIYNDLLYNEYDYEIDMQRASVYYQMGDSLTALSEFKRISADNPNEFLPTLYLGDTYGRMRQYSDARTVYKGMLKDRTDSTEIQIINQRLGWLPPTGFGTMFIGFPSYFAIAPTASFYADNLKFRAVSYGLRVEMGLFNFLSAGASFTRTHLNSETFNRTFSALRWHLYFRFSELVSASVGYGSSVSLGEVDRAVYDVSLRVQRPEEFSFYAVYERLDARMLLNSPFLINTVIFADAHRLGGFYQFPNKLRISANYNHIAISDGNKGNDFLFRIGREWYENFRLGYEFFHATYARSDIAGTPMALRQYPYYTPQKLNTHSLWAEWDFLKDENVTLTLGGKLGYLPAGDFIIREAFIGGSYSILPGLALNGRLAVGSTYRFDQSYDSVSGIISLYWTL